jgi:hypothetical protein
MNPIPVQELRIGNVVINIENGIRSVILCDMINLRQNHIPSEYKPDNNYWTKEQKEFVWNDLGYNEAISISEMWLLISDFDRKEFSHGIKYYIQISDKYEICIDSLDPDGSVSIQTISSGWKWYQPHIKHVHQLQNLYYSLTNEELQLDISKFNQLL